MPSSCVFQFEKPDLVFFSGETMTGTILLTTNVEKTVRSVYISFVGMAKVNLPVSKKGKQNESNAKSLERVSAKELYVNNHHYVFTGGKLSLGLHIYSFRIPIPDSCPTSCEESYGEIKYVLKLVLERSRTYNNEFHQPVTVIKQLDLNLSPDLLLPIEDEDVKYFCCWPCTSGPVCCTLTIPFGGYAPGQKIKYTLTVDNQSPAYDLEGIELKLKQIYTFLIHFPTQQIRKKINTLASVQHDDHCLRSSKHIFEGDLLIPPVPPSCTDSDLMIEIKYEIEVNIDCGSYHNDTKLVIPITIGTIPLIQSISYPCNAGWSQPISEQPISGPERTSGDLDFNKPPGSECYIPLYFEEATHIAAKFIDPDVDERHQSVDFIPKYPFYPNFGECSAPPTTEMQPPEQITP